MDQLVLFIEKGKEIYGSYGGLANEAHRKTPVPGHETRKSKANTNPAIHRKNAVFRPSH